MTDLLRRSVETFIHMQEEFLKIAGKQTHTWVEAAKAGKPFHGEPLMELARDGMENFMKAQKQFLDVIVEETAKATGQESEWRCQESQEDRTLRTGAPGHRVVSLMPRRNWWMLQANR